MQAGDKPVNLQFSRDFGRLDVQVSGGAFVCSISTAVVDERFLILFSNPNGKAGMTMLIHGVTTNEQRNIQ